jgi:hypothetical protein
LKGGAYGRQTKHAAVENVWKAPTPLGVSKVKDAVEGKRLTVYREVHRIIEVAGAARESSLV